MGNSLAEIRARLKDMEEKKGSSSKSQSDNTVFPHWSINEGETAVIRFLPDDDPNNTFFWVERQVIRLTFPGVKGGDENKPVTIQVPCGEMFGDPCPVLTAVRPFFKDPALEELGRKYWKKRSYIFQGFVVENPMEEDSVPENPIRRFMMTPQIFNIIKEALMDPDLEDMPTDFDNGLDFRISKTSKGQFADYTTSKWRTKATALTQDQRAAITEHGLFDLKSFLPERPSADHYAAIGEMFEASVDGDLYDPDRWGQYYKPYGLEITTSSTPPVAAPAQPAAEQTTNDEIPFDGGTPVAQAEPTPQPEPTPAPASSGKSADDVLAMIRNRQSS